MKKLLLLSIPLLVLSACGSNNTKEQVKQQLTDETKPLINVQEKVKQVEQKLKKAGITGEKLKQVLKKQKANYEIIANLKGDARNKYILETEVLNKIPKKLNPCGTNSLNNFAECMNRKNISLNEVLKYIPKETQDTFKKSYYYSKYSITRKNLLEASNDPIAIEMKKKKIQSMVYNGIITKPSVCSQLPEKEVQDYCKSLFESK